ncbi:hypothetical protein GCM10022244_13760 [Streptomyces gulbargensis]|uniref:Uncharacterized protein n=1 Tax=Streptomyces gulbargensis TaxID=364901 RepID=A0ABP7LPQ1_9ACTN
MPDGRTSSPGRLPRPGYGGPVTPGVRHLDTKDGVRDDRRAPEAQDRNAPGPVGGWGGVEVERDEVAVVLKCTEPSSRSVLRCEWGVWYAPACLDHPGLPVPARKREVVAGA